MKENRITGLRDVNYEKIIVNDIFKLTNSEAPLTYKVFYNQNQCQFQAKCIEQEGITIFITEETSEIIEVVQRGKNFSKEELEALAKMFPMWKIEMEDTYRYRDIDCDYQLDMEPHELLRTGHISKLSVKDNVNEEYREIYRLPHNIFEAGVKFNQIKENYDYWTSTFVKNKPVMFTYENQVFKNPYVMFDQLCISGKPIEPDRYFTKDGEGPKVDFSESYVFTYPENELLILNGKGYMNGEIVITPKELKDADIAYHRLSNMFPKEVQDWVEAKLPAARSYSGHMCSGGLNRKVK